MMGATAVAIIYSPWGKRSGAHFNPSVTLTFLRLGKVEPSDALFYVVFQFLGGFLGVLLARALLGMVVPTPAVKYAATLPGPRGTGPAFIAEAVISFVLMLVLLLVSNTRRLARLTGMCAGILVASYIAFEAPISGMSMNPARTLASAVPAHAYRLAPSGKRILLLERGDYVPRERDNWDTRAVVTEGKYHIKEAWYDRDGKEFHAGTHYFVGGNTKFYGAALLRMRRDDFGEIRHHGGISPAWPISYDDLEPYYTEAERLYQVHGARGEDPTEPEASVPYAYPAISHEPRLQRLSDDLTKLGYRP